MACQLRRVQNKHDMKSSKTGDDPTGQIVQTKSTMVNSITLSSDSERLYLIEEKQVLTFDLSQHKGVLISNVENQLVAASSGLPDKNIKSRIIQLPTQNKSWQILYKPTRRTLIIIGVDDLEFNLQGAPLSTPDCGVYGIDMRKFNVTLIRQATNLVLYMTPKAGSGKVDDI